MTIAEKIEREPAEAAKQLRAAVARNPANAGALRLLGRALRKLGEDDEAAEAEMAAVRATAQDPEMVAIAVAMNEGDLQQAEQLLRQRLHSQPTDVAAIRLMAELAARIGRLPDSEKLLHRALELAPSFTAARANLANVLYKQSRYGEAAKVHHLLRDT